MKNLTATILCAYYTKKRTDKKTSAIKKFYSTDKKERIIITFCVLYFILQVARSIIY